MSNFYIGHHTEAVNTAIVEVIPGLAEFKPRIDTLCYKTGTAKHTINVMKAIAATEVYAPSESGTNQLTLKSVDPGETTAGVDETLAANDWIGWICENGMYHVDYITTVSSNVVTLANNLTTDVNAGQTIWTFYEVGRSTHIQLEVPASTTLEIKGPIMAGFSTQKGQKTSREGSGDPLMVHIDNVTDAGELLWIGGYYGNGTVLS